MGEEKKPIKIELVESGSFFRKVCRNPVRFYVRCGFVTFGICFASNFASGFMPENSQYMIEHPQLFTMGVLMKSIFFGTIWPAFYLTGFFNPKETLMFMG